MEDYTIKIGIIEEWEAVDPTIAAKIIEKYNDINVYFEWWECEIDDYTTALEAVGFRDVQIGFTGFWSQGDGANFIGKWSSHYARDLTQIAGEDPVLVSIRALDALLQKIGKNHDWRFSLRKFAYLRYAHENTVSIFDAEFFHVGEQCWDALGEKIEDAILAACRDVMQEIYSSLERTYEDLTSAENVRETLIANAYKFDREGKIYA